MAFSYDDQYTILDNAPALISVVHTKFDKVVNELNNLGRDSEVSANVITEGHIKDKQVTPAKFNITTKTPAETLLTDVVTKKYIDDNISLNTGQMLDSPDNVDSEENPFESIASGNGTDSTPFIYHWYKAQSDGFLIVRSIAKPNQVRSWCAVMATKDLVGLENSKLGTKIDSLTSGHRNEVGNNVRPDCVRGETHQSDEGTSGAAGVRSLTVVLRKDEYFKIHCVEENTNDNIFKEAVWIPFGKGYKCKHHGLDTS